MAKLRVAVFDNVEVGALNDAMDKVYHSVDGPPIEYIAIKDKFGKKDQTALVEAMQGFDGAVVRSSTNFFEALDKLPNLKFIGRAGIGVDSIDVTKASNNGVFVFYAPDSNSASVAEMVFGQIGELERKVGWQHGQLRAGVDEGQVKRTALGKELYEKTIGIVGVGNIGAKVAAVGLGYGMNVRLFDAIKQEGEISSLVSSELRKRGLVLADESKATIGGNLDELLSQSDYVTVHVPKTDRTIGLIGASELHRMKKGSILINNSREGIVDEFAVLEALREGHLRGYVTDVLEKQSPLHGHEQVLVTAHTGGNTKEAQIRAARMIGDSVLSYVLSGGKEITRAYNHPSMDDSLRAAYNLTRIMSAFAAQYIGGRGQQIKEIGVQATGLTSYDSMAIKMAAAAGTALSYGELNGRGDLPALGLLEKKGIKVYSTEARGARPGLASRISIYYTLQNGENVSFRGEVEPTETGGITYTLKTADGFSGRGVPLLPAQYILAEHGNVPKQVGRVGSAIGDHDFNITHFDLMSGGHGTLNNLIACAVAGTGRVPTSLLEAIKAETGTGSRATFVDLRNYHSS